ncbi:MAG: glycosyltransferase family 4 protein [Crocinitomicaceae bacterium]|nr:glycosyltransferase family 4 protein [Crocinitomicaceae bacterium]
MENQKLKIVFVCGWYSSPFGYMANYLPRALAQKGCDVHIVTSTSQKFSTSADYKNTYETFLGPPYTDEGVYQENGVTIHRLPVTFFKTEVLPKKVFKTLRKIKPDVVHIFDIGSLLTFKLAVFSLFLKYKFINSNHIHYSVFPMFRSWKNMSWIKKTKWKLLHTLPGKFIYRQTYLSICPHEEGRELSILFFGFKRNKTLVKSLSVDTQVYHPISLRDKNELKMKYGFVENDFVLVYSGRFSEDKNPLVLAKAVEILNKNNSKIKGLFIGNGPQEDEIKSRESCVIHPFTNQETLSKLYAMSDVGVWPRQESTSMLDCLACGSPIIVNSTVEVKDRIEGNGLYFEIDNVNDLAIQIEKLYNSPELTKSFSEMGIKKIQDKYSWYKYADDYINLLNGNVNNQ